MVVCIDTSTAIEVPPIVMKVVVTLSPILGAAVKLRSVLQPKVSPNM